MDTNEKQNALLLSCPLINTATLAKLGVALNPADLLFLQSLAIIRKFAKNTILAYTNERIKSLLFLYHGIVRFVDTSECGLIKTLVYVAEGCFLGEAAFFHQQPVLYDLHFLEDSEVFFIDSVHLPLIVERPRLMLFLMTSTSLASRILAMQIEDAAFRTAEEKICRMLSCLNGNEKAQYKLSFTHQEIADFTGVHRVNVTNTLNLLKKEGVITTATRGNIAIINRDKLLQRLRKKDDSCVE